MDDRAFAPDQLFAHAGFIRRIARALVRDEHAADDVVQETFAAALASPPRRGGPLGPWLATLTRNFARELWRRDQRRSERERAAARGELLPSAASLAEREESLRIVVEAVLALAEPYRSTIIQRFYEDLPPRVIAARSRVPVETVHTRLRRAIVQLRETLGAGKERRDWRAALLVYAGEGAHASGASVATSLLLAPTILLMKTKTFLAAALLLTVSVGVYTLVGGPGEKTPVDAMQSSAPALAVQSATSRPGDSAPDVGSADPVRRVAVSGPQPPAEVAAAEDPDSLPEWFDVVIRVLDARGKAAPDARVELWETSETLPIREFARKKKGFSDRRPGKAPALRATTNAEGRCLVRIEREPLMVRAEHPLLGATGEVPWSHWRARSEKELTLTLEPLVPVSVLVLRADSLPAAGVMVEVFLSGGKHENPWIPPPAPTDLEGRCRFALNQGYSFGFLARDGKAPSLFGRAATTKGIDPLEVVLRFPGALSLAGTLRATDGTPVAGKVVLWEQRTNAERKEDVFGAFHTSKEIGEGGEFRIDLPHEGRFELIGSAPGHANSEIVTLEVSQDLPHARGDVRLTRPASLTGVVVRENGAPVAAARLRVTVSSEGSGWSGAWSEIGPPDRFGRDARTATSNADGVFRIEGLDRRARYALTCVPDARKPAARLTRNVVTGDSDLRLVITADHLESGRIVGTVVAESTGKPITRFQQWRVDYRDGEGFVPSNELDVQDERGAFRSPELGFGQTHALAIACDDYAPALAGPITISQGEHRFEVRLPDFGTVAISVLEADGSPAANVELLFRQLDIVPRNRGWSPQRTGDDGTFLWRKVPPGRYLVIASRDPKDPEQKECEVRSGRKTAVEIRLLR